MGTLQPLKKEPAEEASAVIGLRELRNKVAFGLLLINGLLVLVIYLLQINKELLAFEFVPYGKCTCERCSYSNA